MSNTFTSSKQENPHQITCQKKSTPNCIKLGEAEAKIKELTFSTGRVKQAVAMAARRRRRRVILTQFSHEKSMIKKTHKPKTAITVNFNNFQNLNTPLKPLFFVISLSPTPPLFCLQFTPPNLDVCAKFFWDWRLESAGEIKLDSFYDFLSPLCPLKEGNEVICFRFLTLTPFTFTNYDQGSCVDELSGFA